MYPITEGEALYQVITELATTGHNTSGFIGRHPNVQELNNLPVEDNYIVFLQNPDVENPICTDQFKNYLKRLCELIKVVVKINSIGFNSCLKGNVYSGKTLSGYT